MDREAGERWVTMNVDWRSGSNVDGDAWDDRPFVDDSPLWEAQTARPDAQWDSKAGPEAKPSPGAEDDTPVKTRIADRLRPRRPHDGALSIVVANDGGGYGKTTIALLMAMELASQKKTRVVAIDAAPGYGSLADRAGHREAPGTVRTAVEAARAGGDVRIHDHAISMRRGLDLLASDNTATADSILTGPDYELLIQHALGQYDIVVTDCSAGLTSPVATSALDAADSLVIVSEGGGGVRSTTWLANYLTHQSRTHPHLKDLLAAAVIVVNSQHVSTNTNLDTVVSFYQRIVRDVLQLGFEQSLEGGAVIDPKRLSATAGRQMRDIAAATLSVGAATVRRP